MVHAGLMTGPGRQAVVLEGDAGEATAAGITVEPAGGSTTRRPSLRTIDFEQAT